MSRRFLGWTDRQWIAAIFASIYGGPGVAMLFMGAWAMAAIGIGCGAFLFWSLSNAGERR